MGFGRGHFWERFTGSWGNWGRFPSPGSLVTERREGEDCQDLERGRKEVGVQLPTQDTEA